MKKTLKNNKEENYRDIFSYKFQYVGMCRVRVRPENKHNHKSEQNNTKRYRRQEQMNMIV